MAVMPSNGDLVYVPCFGKHGVVTGVDGTKVRIKFNPGRGAPHQISLKELGQVIEEADAKASTHALIPVEFDEIPEPSSQDMKTILNFIGSIRRFGAGFEWRGLGVQIRFFIFVAPE